MLIEPKQDIQ